MKATCPTESQTDHGPDGEIRHETLEKLCDLLDQQPPAEVYEHLRSLRLASLLWLSRVIEKQITEERVACAAETWINVRKLEEDDE